MRFTDEDLKRLRDCLPPKSEPMVGPGIDLEALLARLEAAEKFCSAHPSFHDCGCSQECEYHVKAHDEWRKSAGRDGGTK